MIHTGHLNRHITTSLIQGCRYSKLCNTFSRRIIDKYEVCYRHQLDLFAGVCDAALDKMLC